MKAVLLSAFVYPGAGHILLKKYFSSVILIAAASVAVYIVISNVLSKAMLISDKIVNGEVQPDIVAIRELIITLQTPAEIQAVNTAMVILIITWLIGIIDSYRIGRAQQQNH